MDKCSSLTRNINLPPCKSILNRALILDYLFSANPFGQDLKIDPGDNNIPDDSRLLNSLLTEGIPEYCNCENAGTTLRFLTAAAALKSRPTVISGCERMKQRPIDNLVDALRTLGCKIEYTEKTGVPPIRILSPINIDNYPIALSVIPTKSSQFVSALMLVAPRLKYGLTLNFTDKIPSFPYINMTSQIMNRAGLHNELSRQTITIHPFNNLFNINNISIEKDWSSAAYLVPFLAACQSGNIFFEDLSLNSCQGDKVFCDYMPLFGIQVCEENNGIRMVKTGKPNLLSKETKLIKLDMTDTPDLFPTLAVAAAISGMDVEFRGLENLRYKESDRILAVNDNLGRLGYRTEIIDDGRFRIHDDFKGSHGINHESTSTSDSILIKTYHDHRIAMAFSAFKGIRNTTIDDINCISKSFPGFLFI